MARISGSTASATATLELSIRPSTLILYAVPIGGSAMTAEAQKRAAAEYAAGLLEEGMTVGLGSGTTAELAIHAIGKRVQAGLRIVGVPTSAASAAVAASYG